MTWRVAIPLVATALAGCTWGGEAAGPVITGVTTSVTPVLRGQHVVVTATGSGFEPGVVVDFDDPAASDVCWAVRAELRDAGDARVALQDARVLSADTIRARLAGDAGKGTWSLVVVDAAGREARLDHALEVVNCPVNPPNAACDDGDDCTFDEAFYPADRCTGASACAGTSSRPDGDPCTFPCTTGTGVAGACAGGRCAPFPGLCDPPPACAAP